MNSIVTCSPRTNPRSTSVAPPPATEGERVELPNSGCRTIGECRRIGNTEASQPMQVSIILKHEKEVQVPTGPFQAVSRAAFSAAHAASPGKTNSVQEFAKRNGLAV